MRIILVFALLFALATPSAKALTITFKDGTSVESRELSIRGLIRLSKKLGDSDIKASISILRAIGTKDYRDSPYIIAFDRPIQVGTREIFYVRIHKATREHLANIFNAIRVQNPGDWRSLAQLAALLQSEPAHKSRKIFEGHSLHWKG